MFIPGIIASSSGGTPSILKDDNIAIDILGSQKTWMKTSSVLNRIFLVGFADIYEYHGAAWDLSQFSSFRNSTDPNTPNGGFAFRGDGTTFWMAENDVLTEWTPSFSWTIATPTSGTTEQHTFISSIRDFGFGNSGNSFFCIDRYGDIYRFDMSTAWDVTTINWATPTQSLAVGVSTLQGANWLTFNDTGTVFYANEANTSTVRKITLSTGWDLTTATIGSVVYDYGSLSQNLRSINLINGFDKLIAINTAPSPDTIMQFSTG